MTKKMSVLARRLRTVTCGCASLSTLDEIFETLKQYVGHSLSVRDPHLTADSSYSTIDPAVSLLEQLDDCFQTQTIDLVWAQKQVIRLLLARIKELEGQMASQESIYEPGAHAPQPEQAPKRVKIHIAGAAKVGIVNHAAAIPKELKPLLEHENTTLQVVSAEECDCVIGVYRLKGRLVCDDAMKVFGKSSAHYGVPKILVLFRNTPIPHKGDAASMADMGAFDLINASLATIETVYIDEEVWLEDGSNKSAMQNIAKLLGSFAS